MVGDLAPGVVTTGPGTGVDTFLVDAGSELVTVRAHYTLWPTVRRVALISRDTGADTDSVHLSVLTVGTAGIGITGVWLLHTAGLGTDIPVLTVRIYLALGSTT